LASDPGKFLSTVQIGITLIGVLSGIACAVLGLPDPVALGLIAGVTALGLIAVGVPAGDGPRVACWLRPGPPGRAAGAICSIVVPHETAGAAAVLREVRRPQRILTVLGGERMLNVASALLAPAQQTSGWTADDDHHPGRCRWRPMQYADERIAFTGEGHGDLVAPSAHGASVAVVASPNRSAGTTG